MEEGHQEKVCLDQRLVLLNKQCPGKPIAYIKNTDLHLIYILSIILISTPCFRVNKDYQERLAILEREELENLDQRFHYFYGFFFVCVYLIKHRAG